MKQAFYTIKLKTEGSRLYDFTDAVKSFVTDSKVADGLLTCFIRHTSASLLIQENADPDVLRDLEEYFARIVPRDTGYRHDAEGPDDMPSHIKAALTASSLAIPVRNGKAALGAWQGLYLFEHRDAAHSREILLHLIGE
jgi:secondary thiamine-phosphate synthase enzyme